MVTGLPPPLLHKKVKFEYKCEHSVSGFAETLTANILFWQQDWTGLAEDQFLHISDMKLQEVVNLIAPCLRSKILFEFGVRDIEK